MNDKRIASISGLRYLFILGIFFHHCNLKGGMSWGCQYGYIGVTFFLILSGFLLSASWNDRFDQLKYYSFIVKRITKIYPTALLCLSLLAIPALFQHCNCWRYVIYHAFLLQGWYEPSIYSFNHPSWFLSSLFFCYFLFSTLFKLNKNHPHAFYSLFCTLTICYLLVIFYSSRGYYYCYFFPPFRLLDFMVGIILYRFYQNIKQVTINHNVVYSNLAEFGALMVLLLFCIFKDNVPYVIARNMWYWIPMSVLILTFSITNDTPGLISRLLSSRGFTILGDSSMCFFLSHVVVVSYFEHVTPIDSSMKIFLLIIVSTIVSILLHYYFEIPIAKALNTKLLSGYNNLQITDRQ